MVYNGAMQKKIKRQLSEGPITRVEQYLAKRIAPYVPSRITPNSITIVSALAGILTGASYVLTSLSREMILIANLFILLHWIGDALDGALARYRKTSNKTGFYLDHMLDAVTVSSIFIGLYASNLTHTAFPLIFALLYFMLEINVMAQAILFGSFNISVSIFGPAEAQFLLIAGNIAAYFLAPKGILFWDAGSLVGTIILALGFIYSFAQTVNKTMQLDRNA